MLILHIHMYTCHIIYVHSVNAFLFKYYIYTCIHVYMYRCIDVYIYICIYVYMYICIYVYKHITFLECIMYILPLWMVAQRSPLLASQCTSGAEW